ncbi:hypothetical protein [Emticicia sp. SJ17W-69]|uniref:hypothetical protein n=1 Tax=Emticicia sp. SJ17W-69 TaxID=3421657 RepID=UPI003EB9B1CF
MNTQYLEELLPLKKARLQKTNVYFLHLKNLTPQENEFITENFYTKYPFYSDSKTLIQVLHAFVKKSIAPDANFIEALDEFFAIKAKNCEFG